MSACLDCGGTECFCAMLQEIARMKPVVDAACRFVAIVEKEDYSFDMSKVYIIFAALIGATLDYQKGDHDERSPA